MYGRISKLMAPKTGHHTDYVLIINLRMQEKKTFELMHTSKLLVVVKSPTMNFLKLITFIWN